MFAPRRSALFQWFLIVLSVRPGRYLREGRRGGGRLACLRGHEPERTRAGGRGGGSGWPTHLASSDHLLPPSLAWSSTRIRSSSMVLYRRGES